MISASYGKHSIAIGTAVAEARASDLMRRIRDQDHTVWKPEPDGISDRLGWLRAPSAMQKETARIVRFADGARQRFDDVLLMGMGGSSLAAEAFAEVFGDCDQPGPRLRVLDTTDPDRIRALAASSDPLRTLHVAATKSGTTVETRSALRYFWVRVTKALEARLAAADAGDAAEQADPAAPGGVGEHFVAITDPGSPLAHVARDRGFREIFLNPSDVGGRYSALTYFGLVPGALAGAYIAELLERADDVMKASIAGEDGRALGLGVALGVLAQAGRDKLTLTTSPEIRPFADWIEQLVAESTGKEGKGILPVVGEPLGPPASYGPDRVFVDLALADDGARDDALADLERAGHPVVRLGLRDVYDLGGQIALWELATAIAGARLGINPFDQPNVESAKARARAAVEAYEAGRDLPESPVAPLEGAALADFLGAPPAGAYVALHAWVTPSAEADEALGALRLALRDRYRIATTAGYGPRFLHSTGQLHKGDGGGGLFVQFTSEPREDLAIPTPASARDAEDASAGEAADAGAADTDGDPEGPGAEADGGGPGSGAARATDAAADSGEGERAAATAARPLTFGALMAAQAVGDRDALEDAGRRVIRFDIGPDAPAGIRALAAGLAEPGGEEGVPIAPTTE